MNTTSATVCSPRFLGRSRLSYAVIGLGAVSAAVFVAAPVNSVYQIGSFFVPLLLAIGVVAWRVRVDSTALGWPLRVLLAGIIIYVAATLFWYVMPIALGYKIPFPSGVDGMFFGSYVSFAVFLGGVLHLRQPDDALQRRIAFTYAAIMTVSLSSVLWVAIVEPNLHAGIAAFPTAVAIGYPCFILLLFAIAARLTTSTGFTCTAPEVLLLVWIASELVADTLYGLTSANGTFALGSPISVGWMAATTALAALAARPDLGMLVHHGTDPSANRTAGRAINLHRNRRLLLLLIAALTPLGLVAVVGGQHHLLLVAAAVTFALAIYRVSLVADDLEEHRQLADRLTELSDELRHQVMHDSLTGLGNRALLWELLDHALQRRPRRARETTALLLLDLDDFKTVNDTLGHDIGDELLVEVATRLQTRVRPSDPVIRLGGDEFAAILEGVTAEEALHVASRVVAVLSDPVRLGPHAIRPGASVGIYLTEPDVDPRTALRNADLAMYAAKYLGGSRHELFSSELGDEFLARHRTEFEPGRPANNDRHGPPTPFDDRETLRHALRQ